MGHRLRGNAGGGTAEGAPLAFGLATPSATPASDPAREPFGYIVFGIRVYEQAETIRANLNEASEANGWGSPRASPDVACKAYPPRSGVTALQVTSGGAQATPPPPFVTQVRQRGAGAGREPSQARPPQCHIAPASGVRSRLTSGLSGCRHTGPEGSRTYWVWYPHI